MEYAPLERFKERLRQWVVTNAQGTYATPFLVIFAFAESIFFPIPVDVALIPLVIIKAKSWKYYTFVVSVASILGGVVGYAVGFFLFSLVGEYLISLYSLESEVTLIGAWLENNTFWATFVSAFTPIPYKVFAISAGLFHAPFIVFLIASALGRSLRYAFVALLAHIWGAAFARLVLRNFTLVTLALLFVIAVFYIFSRLVF